MVDNREALSQMGVTLANHFDCVFYVDIETGNYNQYVHVEWMDRLEIPESGKDFFADFHENAPKCIYPDDLELVLRILGKKELTKKLSRDNTFSSVYRMIIDGNIEHVRLIFVKCEDKKHVICCLENTEDEFRAKKEREQDLQSAKRMARLDELTGVRNKNAFLDYSASMNEKLQQGACEPFAVVMCDVNDLKRINDTRGHSFGDEVIQSASRMVCGVFSHSPVFRVGGDEFVAVLIGNDYERRERLMTKIKEESLANKRTLSGPVVASGIAIYDPEMDEGFDSVYERADEQMYVVKKELKSVQLSDGFENVNKREQTITDERKRRLDSLFGALYTVAGEGYIYVNDLKFDFSRWSVSLITDFNLESEYMYQADLIWQDYIHPSDLKAYRQAVDAAINGNAKITPIHYRARSADGSYVMLTTRAFILSDEDGNPEYFGGIIIPK